MQNAISRQDYISFLERKLGHKYQKNSETIMDELWNFLPDAINHAKALLALYDSTGSPAQNDPSTTVFKLVEQLIIYAEPFNSRKKKYF